MVVGTFGSLFAVAVHIVPAEFTYDVFELAAFPLKTKPHIEVGTTLIDMSVGTMLPSLAFLFHEVRTNLQVVAEITFVSIATLAQTLELVAWFDLALVVRVRAVI